MKHTGWTHWRDGRDDLTGEQQHAARQVLGKLERRLDIGGVSVGKMTQQLPDGTLIEAAKYGAQPVVRVTPPPNPKLALKPTPAQIVGDDFVVWARTVEQPAGIDAEHPQQVLREGWKTFFYDSGVEGYAEFDGRKATYRERFPAGLRHAGNIDWRNKDGVRLSWYGPSSRYWFDPFVQPRVQYGKKVFLLGHVLFDADAYIAESEPDAPFDERWVMGAALDGMRHLLVVQANLPLYVTPQIMVPEDTVFTHMPVTSEDADVPIQFALCRYAITRNSEDPTKYTVDAQSREVITTFTINNALNPFFFREDATRAVSLTPPRDPFFVSSDAAVQRPPGNDGRAVELLATGAMSITNISLGPGGSAPIAADYRGNSPVEMMMNRQLTDDGVDIVSVSIGASSWVLLSEVLQGTAAQRIERRVLQFADIREAVVVLWEQEFTYTHFGGAVSSSEQRLSLNMGADTVAEESELDVSLGVGLFRTLAQQQRGHSRLLAELPMHPQFFLYQARVLVTGTAPLLRYQGMIGGYSYLPRPPEEYFGGYGLYDAFDEQPLTMISSRSNAQAPLDYALDFDGKSSTLGCAAFDGSAMVSTWAARAPIGAAANLVLSPKAATLPGLTGVIGEKQRYHPIWLLGAVPRQGV